MQVGKIIWGQLILKKDDPESMIKMRGTWRKKGNIRKIEKLGNVQMYNDKDDAIPVDKFWKSTEFIHDIMPSDSDMNKEKNGPDVNPF